MIKIDRGFLLSKFKYNENSVIADFYTEKNGRSSSIIFGGTSKKIKGYLQIGNLFHLNFSSKNNEKVSSIKPGITGLWQVSGRNNLSYKRRVILDLNYVENYNFLMDLRILIRTLGVILFPLDRGAY